MKATLLLPVLMLLACGGGNKVGVTPDLSTNDFACDNNDAVVRPVASCHAGGCGAGEICMQYTGGAIDADAGAYDSTFACVTLPCSCRGVASCSCLSAQNICSLQCSPASDAAGTNVDAVGDFLCLGQ